MLPSAARVSAPELLRTTAFWSALFRHTLPVVGVTVFGWSGGTIALFFVLESWLFLTTRSAVDITFDPQFAFDRSTRTRRQTLGDLAKNVLIAGGMCGVLVFGFGGFVAVIAFSGDEGARFMREGWKQPSFLLSLLGLLATAVADGVRVAQRLNERTSVERAQDDARIRVMFYRNIGLLLGGTVIIAAASAFDVGAVAVVVVISATLIWIELLGLSASPTAPAPRADPRPGPS